MSKKVRAQVMRDYIRKQTQEAITGKPEVVERKNSKQPSQYKGRFKLDTWSHKTKTKALNARRSQHGETKSERQAIHTTQREVSMTRRTGAGFEKKLSQKTTPLSFLDQHHLDPFDSFPIPLTPGS